MQDRAAHLRAWRSELNRDVPYPREGAAIKYGDWKRFEREISEAFFPVHMARVSDALNAIRTEIHPLITAEVPAGVLNANLSGAKLA